MWKPWTQAEVEKLVAEESVQLEELELQKLHSVQQPAAPIAWKRLTAFGDNRLDDNSTWVLARSDQKVLFFDTVEEEFGIGRLTENGQLADYGTYGEKLASALRHFPAKD